MKWEKLDFCFNSSSVLHEFSGAAVPQAIHLHDDVFRIYYSPRDKNNRSHIFFIDLDIERLNIVHSCSEPCLSPGEAGAFDDSGTMMSFIGLFNGVYRLYYIGWNLGKTVPFRNSIGLAESLDGIKFNRLFNGPILDRTKEEPHFCASCWVLQEDLYKMWYLSCIGWHYIDGKIQHYYHIKYAESHNGIDWMRKKTVAIDFKDKTEYAISRPTVIRTENGYHMWFSHRGDKYRIGYASSCDGIHWNRRDEEVGITVSANSFDSEMICYPSVFKHKSDYYMLYNGNAYGMTGFGIAKLSEGKL